MKLRLLTCAFAACVALIASGPVLAQKKGGDVIIAMTQAPPSLDPHVTSAQVARNVNLHVFETLYARDENARPVPDLAEGVTVSPDGLTYVFTLRRGRQVPQRQGDDVRRTSSHRWSATARSAPRPA